MSMFRSLIESGIGGKVTPIGPVIEPLYLIQNGKINTTVTGGFSTQYVGGSGATLQYSEVSSVTPNYVSFYTGLWGENRLYSNNTISFEDYSKICIDFKAGTQQYGTITFDKALGSAYTDNAITQSTYMDRQTLKFDLPSPIPSTMTKFYSTWTNINPAIQVYNLWLE